MKTEYTYDVAFSCAEEDLPVAKKIAASLKEKGISYYLYTEHVAEHWGENIFKISLDKYGAESRYVLMLISKTYVKKHWADMERQIMQTVSRVGKAYILPLHLGENLPKVDGLNENVAYRKWKDNPGTIAELIRQKLMEKVKEQDGKQKTNEPGNTYNKAGILNIITNVEKLNQHSDGGENKS